MGKVLQSLQVASNPSQDLARDATLRRPGPRGSWPGFGLGYVLCSAVVSALVLRVRLYRLSLAEGLKTRE